MILHVITEFHSAPWDVCGGGAAANVFHLRWLMLVDVCFVLVVVCVELTGTSFTGTKQGSYNSCYL